MHSQTEHYILYSHMTSVSATYSTALNQKHYISIMFGYLIKTEVKCVQLFLMFSLNTLLPQLCTSFISLIHSGASYLPWYAFDMTPFLHSFSLTSNYADLSLNVVTVHSNALYVAVSYIHWSTCAAAVLSLFLTVGGLFSFSRSTDVKKMN